MLNAPLITNPLGAKSGNVPLKAPLTPAGMVRESMLPNRKLPPVKLFAAVTLMIPVPAVSFSDPTCCPVQFCSVRILPFTSKFCPLLPNCPAVVRSLKIFAFAVAAPPSTNESTNVGRLALVRLAPAKVAMARVPPGLIRLIS